jgi:hypothetical protein
MADTPNVWIPDDLVAYFSERADADPNITDVEHAIRIVLRKYRAWEEGALENPLEDLKLDTITCTKCA